MIVKMTRHNRAVLLTQAAGFVWKPEEPTKIIIQDLDGKDTIVDLAVDEEEIKAVFVYSSELVIFTLDVATGKPVTFYNV